VTVDLAGVDWWPCGTYDPQSPGSVVTAQIAPERVLSVETVLVVLPRPDSWSERWTLAMSGCAPAVRVEERADARLRAAAQPVKLATCVAQRNVREYSRLGPWLMYGHARASTQPTGPPDHTLTVGRVWQDDHP
jgi:hypothetical protein